MKRLKLKINKNLKMAVIVAGILGAVAFTQRQEGIKAIGTTFAFTGLVAGLKKNGKWDDLDEGTQAFAKASDVVAEKQEEEMAALKNERETLKKELDAVKEAIGDTNISDLPKDLKTKFEELQDSVKTQAELIAKLKTENVGGQRDGAILAALKENEANIKSFIAKEKGALTIEVKTVATQIPSNIATHTIGDYAAGITQIPVRKPFLEDIFPTVPTTKEYIKYMDQETVVRDAKNVVDITATDHTTKLTWKERQIQIVKVRDLIDVSSDMMDDYDFVEGEIRNLITSSVQLKVDDGLLLGTGVSPELHSVNEASSEFDAANTLGGAITKWENNVDTPNIFDLVVAMSAQIQIIGKENGFFPDTVLWNSIDKYKSMLIKDENGQYLTPPFVSKVGDTEYSIDSIRVRANPNVPANTMYVFDSSKGTLYTRKGITLEMSRENATNFETETVTIKATRRMNLLIKNGNANAFMKCSDIESALAAISDAV